MIEALNHDRRRSPKDAELWSGVAPCDLDSPEAQPVLARIGGAICSHSPIDRVQHAKLVAAVALSAKRCPNNAYAKATL